MTEHKIYAEISDKNYRTQAICRCGAKSSFTTKRKAYEWFDNHNPFGSFTSIFNSRD
jgi:thymidine kinase